jgi:hypothetical protein
MNVKNKFTMKNKIGAKLAVQGMAESLSLFAKLLNNNNGGLK